jgi:N-acetylglucosaminyldiphosphoundecaprenol N-acetyl-beta-D-mannosaminyltransferase
MIGKKLKPLPNGDHPFLAINTHERIGAKMPVKAKKQNEATVKNSGTTMGNPPLVLQGNDIKVNILGLSFPFTDYKDTLSLFTQWIASREPHQVCIANVHTIVTSLSDTKLKEINNRSFITMDGLPLVWYARAVHKAKIKERVCGPELMLRCLGQGCEHGWKHFFLGGKEEVLTDLVDAMQSRFPGVDIAGWHSPPFRPLSSEEDNQLVDMINQHQPDFLWVGLGAPKQEKWIASHLTKINAPVQIGVGAAFDFHSGHIKRAPLWMQKYGLEWLFRMLQDRRLIKRYFATNPVFLAFFIRDYITVNFRKRFI